MVLGTIIGKSTTSKFSFKLEGNASKFQYVQANHPEYGEILGQIREIEREKEAIAHCSILGYAQNNKTQLPRSPLHQNTEVLNAEESLIKAVLNLQQKNAAYVGTLETRNLKIFLNLNQLLTKHIAILAKTGAGKSYTAGIIAEEILERNVPLLIIDPHGEYMHLSTPNAAEQKKLQQHNLTPKGYETKVYGDPSINKAYHPIRLNDEFTPIELLHILPAKLSQTQRATVYSIIKDLNPPTLSALTEVLSEDGDVSSLNLISILEYIDSLELFSSDFTPYNELIRPGKCTILNLKGIPPDVQQIIVYKILKDLFEQRKLGNIAPFFTLIEEAHNFAPERSFGETKSSFIIRTIASEGRKFGLGLCCVTQRPARLDKNVLSQCNTQIILKVTNPNDIKSILNSVENINSDDEIKSLPVGTALITGVTDIPLLVRIRPRRSKHGGATVNILEESEDMIKDLKKYEKKEILPIIPAKTTKDSREKLSAVLIPAFVVSIDKKYRLLIEAIKGHVIADVDTKRTIPLKLPRLSKSQTTLFKLILSLRKITLPKLIERTDVPVLRIKEILDQLIKLNLITKKDSQYLLTDISAFSKNPQNYQLKKKLEYLQVNYKSKLTPKIRDTQLKKLLHPHKITDVKKCFIAYYKVDQSK